MFNFPTFGPFHTMSMCVFCCLLFVFVCFVLLFGRTVGVFVLMKYTTLEGRHAERDAQDITGWVTLFHKSKRCVAVFNFIRRDTR